MDQRKMNARLATFASDYNAQLFLIEQVIKQSVCTAIPVRVDSVNRNADGSGAGTLSATPLVAQTDADGNLIAPVSLPRLPYFRYQHGTAAVICDPVPGDIGLAIFAQQDCSRVNGGTEPVVPGSFRSFDMSDGFYIGGFFGKKPETFVHLEQSGTVRVVTPVKVQIESPQIELTADESVKLTAPQIYLNGQVTSGGTSGASATFTGRVDVTDDVTASGISLKAHVHSGVQTGGSNTGAPVG